MSQRQSYTLIKLMIFVLTITAMLSACERGKPDRAEMEKVKQVMEMRQTAIHNKDIELYKQAIFPGYSDGGVKYDGIIADMEAKFKNYEKIEFTFQRSTVDMDMNSARMVGQISYKATGMEKPVYARERTIFRRVDGKWMISAGLEQGKF